MSTAFRSVSDVAFGQIEQRVDLGDGQLVAPATRALDHVARSDPTFADDSEVEARAVMGDKQIRHLGLAEPHAHPEARHPRLGYLELRLADAVAVADADLVVAEAGDGEVLAEHPRHQIVTVEVAPPMVVGLGLVDHHGPLFAAVAAEVALTVSVDVQPADHHRFGHRVLVDAGVDGLAAPRHVGGHADVHRHQRRRHAAQMSGSPPSTFNVTPVRKVLVSANSTASATSSTVPMRPAGLESPTCAK